MKIRKTFEDYSVDTVAYCFLILFGLSTLVPFLHVIAKAFSGNWAVTSGKVGIWPIDMQVETFKYVITSVMFVRSFFITVVVTVVGTVLSLIVIGITAYPLSKKELPGIKVVLLMFVFTMLFSGGMIPFYLLIKTLGLIDNLFSVILPPLVSVFYLLIIKNYYESLPESLEESARLDGASDINVLFSIIIPLSKPVFATIALFTAVNYWNEYFYPMLFLNKEKLKTLQLYLVEVIASANESVISKASLEEQENLMPENVRASALIASTLPIALVYPFLQKYFMKGILIGSVKG